jgi:hypothetical protein
MQLHFGVEAPLQHESRLTGSVEKRFQKAAGERGLGQRRDSRIANAAWVAGPGRISFLRMRRRSSAKTPRWFGSSPLLSLELRFLFTYASD